MLESPSDKRNFGWLKEEKPIRNKPRIKHQASGCWTRSAYDVSICKQVAGYGGPFSRRSSVKIDYKIC